MKKTVLQNLMGQYSACVEPQSKHPNAGEIKLALGLEKFFSRKSFLLPQSGFNTSIFPLASSPQLALGCCVLLGQLVLETTLNHVSSSDLRTKSIRLVWHCLSGDYVCLILILGPPS